jgi:hypothetical protein
MQVWQPVEKPLAGNLKRVLDYVLRVKAAGLDYSVRKKVIREALSLSPTHLSNLLAVLSSLMKANGIRNEGQKLHWQV